MIGRLGKVASTRPPLLDRLRVRLGYWLLRRDYDAHALLLSFNLGAQATTSRTELIQHFFATLERILGPSYVAFYRKEQGQWVLDSSLGSVPAVELGRTEPPDVPGAMTGPYRVLGELIGLVVVGPRRARRAYNEQDRNLFIGLMVLTALRLALYDYKATEQAMANELAVAHEASLMQEQFLNLVSHELRTPISIILAAISFLSSQDEVASSPLLERYCGRIYRNAELLMLFLEDLLNAGQLNSGHFMLNRRVCSLSRLVQEALQELGPLAEEKQHHLEYVPIEQPLEVFADGQRVQQVILNLVINAIKHNPPGRHLRVKAYRDSGHLRFEIQDDGVGIGPAQLPKLFERFSRLSSEHSASERGVGLGLFIAKAIIEAHGGTLGVDSQLGRGSTFWFELPVGETTGP